MVWMSHAEKVGKAVAGIVFEGCSKVAHSLGGGLARGFQYSYDSRVAQMVLNQPFSLEWLVSYKAIRARRLSQRLSALALVL
jgi:alpha-beta hydrolase superfamily lysophospholipase